jgi:hypothetical protein
MFPSTSKAGSVLEKLDFLVRFWELKARHATTSHPLRAAEQVELLSLLQLMSGDLAVPQPGLARRFGDALPAQLIGDGSVIGAELRCVSAGAIVAVAAEMMAPGSQMIVRVSDAVTGTELVIPCTVLWCHQGATCTMAFAVDGVPIRSHFATMQRVQTYFGTGRNQRTDGGMLG